MRITSILTKLAAFPLIFLLAVLAPTGCRAEGSAPQVTLPNGDALCIVGQEYGPLQVERIPAGSHVAEPVRLQDRGLVVATTGLTDLLAVGNRGFLQGGRTFIVLAITLPSTVNRGTGYCGAGTEDSLLLLEWTPEHTLKLDDRLLVQSCLQSLALQSDQGSDLDVLFPATTNPAEIVLSWFEHPQYGSGKKTVSVKEGHFLVE